MHPTLSKTLAYPRKGPWKIKVIITQYAHCSRGEVLIRDMLPVSAHFLSCHIDEHDRPLKPSYCIVLTSPSSFCAPRTLSQTSCFICGQPTDVRRPSWLFTKSSRLHTPYTSTEKHPRLYIPSTFAWLRTTT